MAQLNLTDLNYQEHIRNNKSLFIVDFWATWCVPCKSVDPILEELEKEYEGKITVAKINADENPRAVADLNVMSMPTIVFFKGAQPVKALVGAHGKETYKQTVEELLVLEK